MRISDWSSDVCSSDLSFGYCAKKGRGDGFVAGPLCNVTGGHVPEGARSSDWINSSAVIPCWREVLARARYSRQAVILPSSLNSKTATSGKAVHLFLRQGESTRSVEKTLPCEAVFGRSGSCSETFTTVEFVPGRRD